MILRTHFLKAAIVSMSFLILIFGAYANSYAATHYVDNAANGANNGSSWNDAWESFADISWGSVSAGDTIFISGDSTSKTYRETLTIRKSGSSGQPIKITKGTSSGHKGKVIIDGDNARIFVRVNGYDYIHLSHITGIDCGSSGGSGCVNIDNSSYSRFEYFTMEDYDNTHGAIHISNSDNCTIGHNTISTATYTSTQVDGIYGQVNRNNIYESNDITVQNNYSSPHDDCIQLFKDTSPIIRNNKITVYCPSATDNKQGIYMEKMEGTTLVYNNIVTRNTGPNASGMTIGFENAFGGSGTVKVYNNTSKVLMGKSYTIKINGGGTSVIVKNNILWATQGNYVLLLLQNTPASTSQIDNNIYYHESSSYIASVGGSTKTWTQWKGSQYDVNGFNTNPFLDDDLKPVDSNSPSVDATISISNFSTDKDGTSRPQGIRWDIGAYEFVQGKTSQIPSVPANLRIIN